ncbi:MAG: hypothetical protein K6L73_06135 [Cellvibrionaceae bacterium]
MNSVQQGVKATELQVMNIPLFLGAAISMGALGLLVYTCAQSGGVIRIVREGVDTGS